MWQYRDIEYQTEQPKTDWINTTQQFVTRNLAPHAKCIHYKIANWITELEQHPNSVATTTFRQYRYTQWGFDIPTTVPTIDTPGYGPLIGLVCADCGSPVWASGFNGNPFCWKKCYRYVNTRPSLKEQPCPMDT